MICCEITNHFHVWNRFPFTGLDRKTRNNYDNHNNNRLNWRMNIQKHPENDKTTIV